MKQKSSPLSSTMSPPQKEEKGGKEFAYHQRYAPFFFFSFFSIG